MTKNEYIRMSCLMGEAREALDLIVNHPEASGLGTGGDSVFKDTIRDIDAFKESMVRKYGPGAMFAWDEPQ